MGRGLRKSAKALSQEHLRKSASEVEQLAFSGSTEWPVPGAEWMRGQVIRDQVREKPHYEGPCRSKKDARSCFTWDVRPLQCLWKRMA